jgi:hypothetical protein
LQSRQFRIIFPAPTASDAGATSEPAIAAPARSTAMGKGNNAKKKEVKKPKKDAAKKADAKKK